MKKLVKMHGFWAMLMIAAGVMCVVTGHQMVHRMREDKAE